VVPTYTHGSTHTHLCYLHLHTTPTWALHLPAHTPHHTGPHTHTHICTVCPAVPTQDFVPTHTPLDHSSGLHCLFFLYTSFGFPGSSPPHWFVLTWFPPVRFPSTRFPLLPGSWFYWFTAPPPRTDLMYHHTHFAFHVHCTYHRTHFLPRLHGCAHALHLVLPHRCTTFSSCRHATFCTPRTLLVHTDCCTAPPTLHCMHTHAHLVLYNYSLVYLCTHTTHTHTVPFYVVLHAHTCTHSHTHLPHLHSHFSTPARFCTPHSSYIPHTYTLCTHFLFSTDHTVTCGSTHHLVGLHTWFTHVTDGPVFVHRTCYLFCTCIFFYFTFLHFLGLHCTPHYYAFLFSSLVTRSHTFHRRLFLCWFCTFATSPLPSTMHHLLRTTHFTHMPHTRTTYLVFAYG